MNWWEYDMERQAALERAKALDVPPAPERPLPQPLDFNDRTQNELRPLWLQDLIGQSDAKNILRRYIDAAKQSGRPLDHVFLQGPAGTGKTTMAQAIANEMGALCYQVEAPVSHDVLVDLQQVMRDGDCLIIDEVHQQAIRERRGKESITTPEVFLHLLEDFVLATSDGMVPFPRITVIGATTDAGMLPDPFVDRFPIQPRLVHYSDSELAAIARMNAEKLGVQMEDGAADVFGRAAPVPRWVNRFMKNAVSLSGGQRITRDLAVEVVTVANSMTLDGLTFDQQNMLKHLLRAGRRENAKGEVAFVASARSIATGIGMVRDRQGVELRVEPDLIRRGYITMTGAGRKLTDAGIERAQKLLAA